MWYILVLDHHYVAIFPSSILILLTKRSQGNPQDPQNHQKKCCFFNIYKPSIHMGDMIALL
jgi:hypothetical protein